MSGMLYLLAIVPLLVLISLAPVSELLAWLSVRRNRAAAPVRSPRSPPRLLFLVPAHDEEKLIHGCVRSLFQMDYPANAWDVVVIADNCADHTAERAWQAGARCMERHDPRHPGKPRALAWALERLQAEAWDACVIVDADTEVDRRFARSLARNAPLEEKCVQAYFDLSNEYQSWLTRLAGLLARVKYEHTYPLKRAAGLNCPLNGNGMLIGRKLLASGWPAFSLTENWELYALFTAGGVEIEYEREAHLFSQEASSLGQAQTQRRRWLAGRLWVLGRYARRLLASRRIGTHQKLDVIAELASPSPVLHGAAAAVVAISSPLLLSGVAATVVATIALGSLLPLAIHTVSAAREYPEKWQLAGCLVLLPLYAFWRIVTAVLTIDTMREGRWKKTERA